MVINNDNCNNLRFEVHHLQIFENTSILMTVGEIRGNPPVIGNLPENSNHSNEAYVSWRWKTRIFKSCISIFKSCENLPICFHIFCTNYENNGKGQGLKSPNRGESPQFFGVGTHICPLCQKWLPTEKHSHAHKLWMGAQSLVILFSERAWKIMNLWKPTQTFLMEKDFVKWFFPFKCQALLLVIFASLYFMVAAWIPIPHKNVQEK